VKAWQVLALGLPASFIVGTTLAYCAMIVGASFLGSVFG